MKRSSLCSGSRRCKRTVKTLPACCWVFLPSAAFDIVTDFKTSLYSFYSVKALKEANAPDLGLQETLRKHNGLCHVLFSFVTHKHNIYHLRTPYIQDKPRQHANRMAGDETGQRCSHQRCSENNIRLWQSPLKRL